MRLTGLIQQTIRDGLFALVDQRNLTVPISSTPVESSLCALRVAGWW
jgi:hypothetical protein